MYFSKMFSLAAPFPSFSVSSVLWPFTRKKNCPAWYQEPIRPYQMKKRVILVGTRADTVRMAHDLKEKGVDSMEVVQELDLNESTIGQLVKLLHERSANSVILNAKHTYFGQVEKAIQTCDSKESRPGWLRTFSKTQISRTQLR